MEIIDLFCGAGGFSLGAHLAGFRTALAVDKDPTLTSSFTRNFPKSKLLLADLSKTSGATLLAEAGIASGESIGIIGGPPCQGFSMMGKRVIADPRNELLHHYFRLVNEIRPRFFVMENVPGLLMGDARKLLDDGIASLNGYETLGPFKVNASEFGAATNRERVIVIGVRGTNPITEALLSKARIKIRSTVADAIADLPSPKKSGSGQYRTSLKISTYAADARKIRRSLGDQAAQKQVKEGRVAGLLPTLHAASVTLRFSKILPGKSDPISRFPRLSWDLPAPTLRAGTGSDHGSFQSVRPIHPEQNRVITVREAARLQGFPDWFDFHETKWHSFRMIGNSVSPKLSQAILSVIREKLHI